jgi:epoxide hydrolase-like predicted phosphatase
MDSQTKIKAILFDFHGVLVFQRENYQSDRIVDAIDREIGAITNDAAFKRDTLEKYGLDEKEFSEVLEKIVDKYEKFPAMWKLLPELRKKYKLAIINNGTFLTIPKFDARHSIYKNFDLFVSSAVEGFKKPDARIYRLAAQRLGVAPEECLFMDDAKINIDGAENIGIKSIWWENKEIGFKKFKDFLK